MSKVVWMEMALRGRVLGNVGSGHGSVVGRMVEWCG